MSHENRRSLQAKALDPILQMGVEGPGMIDLGVIRFRTQSMPQQVWRAGAIACLDQLRYQRFPIAQRGCHPVDQDDRWAFSLDEVMHRFFGRMH
jgi:hypothetical protein